MRDLSTLMKDLDALYELYKAAIHGGPADEWTNEAGTFPSFAKAIQDSILTPNADSAANMQAALDAAAAAAGSESGALVAKNAAIEEAAKALAERLQITDELTQVLAATAQVAEDKALVTSTLIGDEDYVIPAVTQLLATYANVVDTAISDDVWAEHAHKWGAPKQVLAVAEKGKVSLLDLTKPSLPAWEDATYSQAGSAVNHSICPWDVTSVELVGGLLIMSSAGTGGYLKGVVVVDLIADTALLFSTASQGGSRRYNGSWSDRNSTEYGFVGDSSLPNLVDHRVNDLAIYTSDDAPKHLISGLPMPTIAVATDGGVSVLVPDSDGGWGVADITSTGPDSDPSKVKHVAFNDRGELVFSHQTGWEAQYSYIVADQVPDADAAVYKMTTAAGRRYSTFREDQGTTIAGPALVPTTQYGDARQVSPTAGSIIVNTTSGELAHLHENPSDKDVGMVAFQTEDYCTPYMVGDVQAALLCDSEEGVVTGGELVTNGTFDTDTAGWIERLNGGLVSIVAGGVRLEKTASSTSNTDIEQSITVPAGEVWTLGFDVLAVSGSGTVRVELDAAIIYDYSQTLGRKFVDVIGDGTAKTLKLRGGGSPVAGTSVDLGRVSVFKAVKDRSGHDNHAKVIGTLNLSKPAGSDIAVLGGFSRDGATYEPINAVQIPDALLIDGAQDYSWTQVVRGGASYSYPVAQKKSDLGTVLTVGTGGAGGVELNAAVGGVALNSGVSTGFGFYAVTLTYRASDRECRLYIDGVLRSTVTCNAITNPITDNSFIGVAKGAAVNAGSDVSMPVVSRTIPSADQIRDLHRDMLAKLSKPSMLTGTVKALAHDPVRGDDWIACSDGQIHRLTKGGTTFEESISAIDGAAISSVGNISSLKVVDGVIAVAGDANPLVHVPALNLRAPVVKRDPMIRPFDCGEGDTVKVDFYPLKGGQPVFGWKPVRVYVDGRLVNIGSIVDGDDAEVLFDGYRWFVRFHTDSKPGAVSVYCDAVEVK